ncbi:MAG: glutaminyl-peptide cyclotransferase [Planctomycetia bacterium]|nr:glutaminyl-peptide cyclotransferase [Planctomycetia bacterium]
MSKEMERVLIPEWLHARRQVLRGCCYSALACACGAFGAHGYASSLDLSEPSSAKQQPEAPSYSFKLASKIERGTDCYTQGLLFEPGAEGSAGLLYESGGRYGLSVLRKYDAQSGKIDKQIKISSVYFAEGLAAVEDRLYLLTWRERTCLVYDKETFKKVDEFRYHGEGWGLAYDGTYLAMSDGTNTIRFLDPKTFRQKRSISVHFINSSGRRQPINYLNELEFVNGELWANVYQQDYVVRIDPETGAMLGEALNFSTLVPKDLQNHPEYVLNGLAYDATTQRLFITGKCWPVIYVLNTTVKDVATE